jgi:flagellar motor switch/type III secretory pathway protein FliN
MIADLRFSPPRAGERVREACFVPRASIPISAACLVAGRLREALREVLGDPCDVVIGEPQPIDRDAWNALTRDARCYLTRGRQTDVVLVIAEREGQALVRYALGEPSEATAGAPSALETLALERLAARCSPAWDPLCAERRDVSQALDRGSLPTCVTYFDVRLRAPLAASLGVGIVRDLPDPGPGQTLPPRLLARVSLDVRAELGRGTLDAATLAALEPGDIIPLRTKVGAAATLKTTDTSLAVGVCGIVGARQAFRVDTPLFAGALH